MKSTRFFLVWFFVVVANAAVMNSSQLDSKITHATAVSNQQDVPFMASIRLFLKPKKIVRIWVHICAGSLISLKHVLTAAQCIILIRKKIGSELRNAAAFLGSLELKGHSQAIRVKNLEYNTMYDPDEVFFTNSYNIGVILLAGQVQVSIEVNKIDLYPFDDGISKGVTMGWGSLRNSAAEDVTCLKNANLSPTLMSVNITILSYEDCFERLVSIIKMDAINTMCGHGPYTFEHLSVGDAGNPFITAISNKFYVAGVGSYIATSQKEYPNIFVKVKPHMDYIHRAMARLW